MPVQDLLERVIHDLEGLSIPATEIHSIGVTLYNAICDLKQCHMALVEAARAGEEKEDNDGTEPDPE